MRMLTFSSLLFLNVNTRQLPGYIGNGFPFLMQLIRSFFLKTATLHEQRPASAGSMPGNLSARGRDLPSADDPRELP